MHAAFGVATHAQRAEQRRQIEGSEASEGQGGEELSVIRSNGTRPSFEWNLPTQPADALLDRQMLRRLMYPETKGSDGAETKAAIAEEKHELKDVKLQVNAEYPDSAPLMTVPPNILAALPKLPEDLEYRFVSKHMILLDVHANLIVDYVLNAIQ